MTNEVTLHGIVLTSMPVNDYDRRMTILTAERGRITVFAKGARRPTGAFSACTLCFTYAEFVVFEGREAYNLKNVLKPHYFDNLNGNIEATCYGMYFCELAGYLTRDGMEEPGQMKLLYMALLALSKNAMPVRLIRCVYEMRALAIYGEGMKTYGQYYVSRYDGLVPDDCAGAVKVSDTVIYTLKYILGTPIKEVFSFTLKPEYLDELIRIVNDYMGRHIDRSLKSLEVLESMTV